jgi:predicted acyl esterase
MSMLATILVGCGVPSGGTSAGSRLGTFAAHGSVEQIWVVDAAPGARMWVEHGGARVASGFVDTNGSLLFHDLTPGSGYRVMQDEGGVITRSHPVEVMPQRATPERTDIYNQTLQVDPTTEAGYNYITTRDGTTLAAMVRLPGPPDKGPYPTLVEYSGYDEANPAGSGTSIQPIVSLLGFATINVNMRGTGCSGGVYDFFEPLQSLDGYDVIETVARQPWVLNHKVGTYGVSYPGISQLYVAATQPPHLAAITPLSVIDDVYRGVLFPGGIENNGFALSWINDRIHDSKAGGQAWSAARIQQGDQTCIANQRLRLQTPDLLAEVAHNRFYSLDPALAQRYVPDSFVGRIKVPVYLACQFEDEQTGGRCANLIANFTGTDKKWFTLTNGAHIDALDPQTFNRWFDFLELYVAGTTPHLSDLARSFAPVIYQLTMGISGVTLPPDPIQTHSTYAQAKAAFEALPHVRVLFDNGAGARPGAPVAVSEQSFATWPVPNVRADAWYLQPAGGLNGRPPASEGADSYRPDPSARPRTDFNGSDGGVWSALPSYNWTEPAEGKALSYVSAALPADEVMVGTGSVDLWLKSKAPDTDLQVTLSEVRPDGKETYVQNGWLRASMRKLFPAGQAPFPFLRTTPLDPISTFLQSDVAPLRADRWSLTRVEVFPFGHVFHAGSRIRITIEAPGGDRPFWAFDTLVPSANQVVSIGYGPDTPSRVVLPVVPETGMTAAPPCPSLRGEPCRDYLPFTNTPGSSRTLGP